MGVRSCTMWQLRQGHWMHYGLWIVSGQRHNQVVLLIWFGYSSLQIFLARRVLKSPSYSCLEEGGICLHHLAWVHCCFCWLFLGFWSWFLKVHGICRVDNDNFLVMMSVSSFILESQLNWDQICFLSSRHCLCCLLVHGPSVASLLLLTTGCCCKVVL